MGIFLVEEALAPRRMKIYVDGEVARCIGLSIVNRFALEKLSKEENFFEQLFSQEVKGAYTFAIKMLSQRALSSHKLKMILRRHFVDATVIEQVVETCIRKGFLSDDAYAQSFARSCIQKGKSRLEFFSLCKRRGCPCERIFYDEEAALSNILSKKRFSSGKDKKSLYMFLVRKGFSYDSIRKNIEEIDE